MGLDIYCEGLDSNFYMGYAGFHRFREFLAKKLDIPLPFMECFYDPDSSPLSNPFWELKNVGLDSSYTIQNALSFLPIKWNSIKYNSLHRFLYHSDCDGEIEWLFLTDMYIELKFILDGVKKGERYYDEIECLISIMKYGAENQKNLLFR